MRAAAGPLAAIVALCPVAASASGAVYGYAGNAGGPGYSLSLPQTLRGTVAVPLPVPPARPADSLAQLYPVLAACWRTPAEAGAGQATARFSLRRDGSLIEAARITYVDGDTARVRAGLARSALDTVRHCTPADITPGLGRAIAGRPLALRFVFRNQR